MFFYLVNNSVSVSCNDKMSPDDTYRAVTVLIAPSKMDQNELFKFQISKSKAATTILPVPQWNPLVIV